MDFSLDINKQKLVFTKPIIMGIMNVTPDSFYDGGMFITEECILTQVGNMIDNGASIIDIGAVSTRPGAEEISAEQELDRLLKIQQVIIKNFPDAIISIDTFRSQVAKTVIENGAHIINDISGGSFDNKMFDVIAKYKVPYIMMHIQGTPKNMQQHPYYKNVVKEIKLFFEQQIAKLKLLGVAKNIIIDPGFGFGKTLEHNYQLLYHLKSFRELGFPILAGISRKSMINSLINTNPQDALNGTSVLNTIALLNGANILRVHDVKEAVEAIRLIEFYKDTNI